MIFAESYDGRGAFLYKKPAWRIKAEFVNKKWPQKKSKLRKASFSSKLDGAFVAQRSGMAFVIEEKGIGVEKGRNILRIPCPQRV